MLRLTKPQCANLAQSEVRTWGLLTEHRGLKAAVWDSNMSGTRERCAPQPSATLANCTQHDSLISRNANALWRGKVKNTHAHAFVLMSTSHTHHFRVLAVHYLRARSSDRPVKSKKLRYSDATNWLNSLLQRDRKRESANQRGTEDLWMCFINFFLLYYRMVF